MERKSLMKSSYFKGHVLNVSHWMISVKKTDFLNHGWNSLSLHSARKHHKPVTIFFSDGMSWACRGLCLATLWSPCTCTASPSAAFATRAIWAEFWTSGWSAWAHCPPHTDAISPCSAVRTPVQTYLFFALCCGRRRKVWSSSQIHLPDKKNGWRWGEKDLYKLQRIDWIKILSDNLSCCVLFFCVCVCVGLCVKECYCCSLTCQCEFCTTRYKIRGWI